MKLENIILRGRHKKTQIVQLHLYKIARRGKSLKSEHKLVVASDWGKRGIENDFKGYQVSFRDDGNVLGLESDDACTTL